jgi:hypothetical protein
MKQAALILLVAGCGPVFTQPPANPPQAAQTVGEQRLVLAQDKTVRVEANPFARRPVRRADHDVAATLIARDVALVVEPAQGVPVYVSNLLGAALVRRFAGHVPLDEALGAAEVFLVQPVVSDDGATQTGVLVVDWLIQSERGAQLGAVFASRRLSGAVSESDPWQAFTPDDAEFLALQVAGELAQVGPIRLALENAETRATLDRIPTPIERPRPDVDLLETNTPPPLNGRTPQPRPSRGG